MSDENQDKKAGDKGQEDQKQEGQKDEESPSRATKLGRFAKEHPGTALMAAAGVSALLGGELGVGALLGVGATLLVTKKKNRDLRDQLRELLGSTRGQLREWIGSTKDFARRLLPHSQADESGATPPA
jgi:hypothetical protein